MKTSTDRRKGRRRCAMQPTVCATVWMGVLERALRVGNRAAEKRASKHLRLLGVIVDRKALLAQVGAVRE